MARLTDFDRKRLFQEFFNSLLKKADSQLTLVAFLRRRNGKPAKWQEQEFGERVYTITADGIWRGSEGPFLAPSAGQHRNWWTFTGMTSLLRNPEGAL